MEITILAKLIISILTAILLGIIAGLLVKKGNDAKVGLGCGLMFPIALIIFITLQLIIPEVIIIRNNNGVYTHESKAILFSVKMQKDDSFSVSICKNYLANYTKEFLICYPEYYGPNDMYYEIKEIDPIIVPPNSVVEIEHIPNYYFTPAPDQITSKSRSLNIRWSLDIFPNEYSSE